MRQPLVAGNWKMNGTSASVEALLSDLKLRPISNNVEVLVFPGFLHTVVALSALKETAVSVGVQDCSAADEAFGAYTGQVSASQAKDLGCSWVLVGHSERRSLLGETDEVVAQKFEQACKAGLKPVLCVGETRQERESGDSIAVVTAQLDAVMSRIAPEHWQGAVVAYEPVWAIGTGLTATPEQAQEVHAAIRSSIAKYCVKTASATRVLYGGSVKASNAAEIFAMEDIDGGLIGGASLSVNEFFAICHAAGNQ